MPDQTAHENSRTLWPVRLLIAAIVIATLCRLCASNFSWWDDQMTIHQNSMIANPTFASVSFFWKQMTQGLYVPVTFTVWAAIAKIAYVAEPGDEMIYLNPWFFHTANVLLHVGSTLLVFGILRRLFNRVDAALIGALFFGLHPVQVETVGWVSGMKDLLCWFFALAIVSLYLRRVRAIESANGSLWKSWELPACCVLLVLGILSKPTSMVTPAALLVIDGLLLRRRWIATAIELAPLFLITAAGAWVARIAQYVDSVTPSPIWQRPFIICDNINFYLGKILWPQRLGIDYSRTYEAVMSNPRVYWMWIIPVGLALAILVNLRRRPVLAAGAALFLIGFAPVSGAVTFQMQHISLTTDHYLYFSLLGIAVVIAWLVSLKPSRATYAIASVLLAALAARAFDQSKTWHDSETLFQSTMAANPNSAVGRNNLAAAYMGGFYPRPEAAEPLLEEAVRLKPDFGNAYINLARVKASLSRRAKDAGDLAVAQKKRTESLETFDTVWRFREARKASKQELAQLAQTTAEGMVILDEFDRALWWAEKSNELYPDDIANRQLLASLRSQAASRAATRPGSRPTTAPTPRDGSASSR